MNEPCSEPVGLLLTSRSLSDQGINSSFSAEAGTAGLRGTTNQRKNRAQSGECCALGFKRGSVFERNRGLTQLKKITVTLYFSRLPQRIHDH